MKIDWVVVGFVVAVVGFFMLISIDTRAQRLARDDACVRIGFDKYQYILNTDTCLKGDDVYFIIMECEGFLQYVCNARPRSIGNVRSLNEVIVE